jgi:hypothetical protein
MGTGRQMGALDRIPILEYRSYDRNSVSNPVFGLPRVPVGLQTGVMYGWATSHSEPR